VWILIEPPLRPLPATILTEPALPAADPVNTSTSPESPAILLPLPISTAPDEATVAAADLNDSDPDDRTELEPLLMITLPPSTESLEPPLISTDPAVDVDDPPCSIKEVLWSKLTIAPFKPAWVSVTRPD
jgi:hypothetical protein